MTYKVAYNGCYGGFSLSAKAVRRAKEIAGVGTKWDEVCEKHGHIDLEDIPRHDPVLIQVIEELGEEASGSCASLRIAEIESNTYWVDEYDGNESVETQSSICWTVIS